MRIRPNAVDPPCVREKGKRVCGDLAYLRNCVTPRNVNGIARADSEHVVQGGVVLRADRG